MIVAASELKKVIATLGSFAGVLPDRPDVLPVRFTSDGKSIKVVMNVSAAKIEHALEFKELAESFDKFLDLESLNSLKLSGEVHLKFNDKTLSVDNGNIKASLPFIRPDNLIDLTKEVETKLEIPKEAFLAALKVHTYGGHHNPEEAARRPVRIFSNNNYLMLQSYDKQVSAFSALAHGESDVDFQLLPAPLLTTLGAANVDSFRLGANFNGWKIVTDKISVWYPNLIRASSGNFDKMLKEIKADPGYKIEFKNGSLDRVLGQLASVVKAKTDTPKIVLQLLGHKKVIAKASSAKTLNLEVEFDEADVTVSLPDGVQLSGKESIALNFKYLKEFTSNLGKEALTLQWWEYLNPKAPIKGKALSLYNRSGRYIVARLAV